MAKDILAAKTRLHWGADPVQAPLQSGLEGVCSFYFFWLSRPPDPGGAGIAPVRWPFSPAAFARPNEGGKSGQPFFCFWPGRAFLVSTSRPGEASTNYELLKVRTPIGALQCDFGVLPRKRPMHWEG